VITRLTVTDSDGAQNFTFADATVLKGWMCGQFDKPYFAHFSPYFLHAFVVNLIFYVFVLLC